MVPNELLQILCCPETKQPVTLVEKEVVKKINKAIASGSLKNRGGKKITERIDEAVIREDREYIYPVRQNIPIMLIDDAIPVKSINL